LTGIKVWHVPASQDGRVWQPIATAPFDKDIELAVIDRDGPHAVVFACRRILHGWINAQTREQITVHPTHWRPWAADVAAS
jgi:hypothetical protein